MAGPLKNARHERFAQELVKGQTLEAAFAAAGYAPSRKNAQRLRTNEGVATRVAELQGKAAARVAITAADIAAQLDEDRTFARRHKQSAAAVSATMGKAKVLGLIFEQHKLSFDFSRLTDEEAETLMALMSKCQRS